jgi:hypothetical protein
MIFQLLLALIFITIYVAYRWLPGLVIPVAVNKMTVAIPNGSFNNSILTHSKEADPDWKPERYLKTPNIVVRFNFAASFCRERFA